MNKYKIKSSWNPNLHWKTVTVENLWRKSKKINFPSNFAQHLHYGDTLRVFKTDFGDTLAYYANGHLYFTVEPSLPAIDLFVNQYLKNPIERGALNMVLMGVLRKNNLKTSLFFKDNLRTYTSKIMLKMR